MIPKLTREGYLPRGVHGAGLEEIRRRFGRGSRRREELFRGIASVVKLLRKQRRMVKRLLLDGSYVTSKESPEAFDCIVILKRGFDFEAAEVETLGQARQLFHGHLLFAMEEDIRRCVWLMELFGHDRDGRVKGLVEVLL